MGPNQSIEIIRLTEGNRAGRATSTLASAGKVMRAALAVVILMISGSEMLMAFRQRDAVPSFARQLVDWQAPLQLVNSYGLFAVMTTSRVEIVVEGSKDG